MPWARHEVEVFDDSGGRCAGEQGKGVHGAVPSMPSRSGMIRGQDLPEVLFRALPRGWPRRLAELTEHDGIIIQAARMRC